MGVHLPTLLIAIETALCLTVHSCKIFLNLNYSLHLLYFNTITYCTPVIFQLCVNTWTHSVIYLKKKETGVYICQRDVHNLTN